MTYTLSELAEHAQAELRGDGETQIQGVCRLDPGRPQHISYLSNKRFAKLLPNTQAAAVILAEEFADECPAATLVCANPELAYAKVATLFDPYAAFEAGIHTSAAVDASAQVHESASIGANAVVSAGAKVGARSLIGAGSIVGREAVVGDDCRLGSNVSIGGRVKMGDRVRIEHNAAIGGRGFGLGQSKSGWVEIPQLGAVTIGNDVEIGASSTVDRGAIDDTVIEDGVKIDDQVHIGHNCRIGAHTVIAGCSGVSGSVTIGKRCILAGMVGMADHLKIADDVIITGGTDVFRDLEEAGMYSAEWNALPRSQWRELVKHARRLVDTESRLRKLEGRGEAADKQDG